MKGDQSQSGTSAGRMVVAMSGGVDSSVAAALLVEAGHEVIGITLQLYDHGAAVGRKGSCCSGLDIRDARRVADALGIKHYVLDYETRFHDTVMTEFATSYASGETPVPCVTCNQEIKFRDLLDTARDLGAAKLVTGHYIELRDGPHGPELYRAHDADRDQSYFLFATTRAQLAHLAFPLGGMAKSDVRAIARRLELPVADKSDSQDICFVPTGRYADVVERLKPDAVLPGDIVHVDGRKLGTHSGIINFTVGQRRGLGIAAGEPLFVVRLDAQRREVIVGPRSSLQTAELVLKGLNWLGDERLEDIGGGGIAVHARVRSSGRPQPGTLYFDGQGVARVRLLDGEAGVAAGQACVLYADGSPRARVLGGGVIARSLASCDLAETSTKESPGARHASA